MSISQPTTNTDWAVANQHYLTGMLKLLRQQLEWYLSTLKNKSEKKDRPVDLELVAGLEKTASSMQQPPAIERLVSSLQLSAFEKDILLMCAGMELDAGLGDLIASIQGDASFFQPTFGLAVAALQNPHWSAVSPAGPLRYRRLIEINRVYQVVRSPLKIEEHILHYLAGITGTHEIIKEIATPVTAGEQLAPSQQTLADDIVQTIRRQEKHTIPPVIFLNGAGLSDKAAIAANAASILGLQLFVISAYAVPVGSRDAAELVRIWNREAALNDYLLYLDCTDLDKGEKQRMQSVTSFIENIQTAVILNSDQGFPDLKRTKVFFDIKKPAADEQKLLWKMVLANENLPEAGLNQIVSQFNLSADIIRKAGYELKTHLLLDENDRDSQNLYNKLWAICCHYTRPQVDELAQRIEPVASWADIVLPEAQVITLSEIAAQVKHRNKVYETWGFGSKGARGLGISVLFAGESGTGKTMAAEVLANELKLDLYRIDLSKVVNKYIGETEKNLKRIFDAAEDGGAILLFDEADALFGKRSDVKDSHDRYSNIEVSYLLQRMEAYRGLAILTTNMKNALDKAFLRRIRFVIHFPFPDASQRTEIWKKVFPAGTPKNGLDMERLGKFTIPGGNIRNIAMNAAFLAADDDVQVQMSHIIRAARSEYAKIEKPFVSI